MTTCPHCGAETTDAYICPECGFDRAFGAAPEAKPTEQVTVPREGHLVDWLKERPVRMVVAVGVLALVVGGGIGWGLGQIGGDDSTTASAATPAGSGSTSANSAALTLPAKLSGSFTRSKTVDTQIADSVASAKKVLGAGTDMALYTYKKKQVLVEATRLQGMALLSAGMTYSTVGDTTCASVTSTSGSEAICLRAGSGLTVKVTATDAKTASAYADEVYNQLV